MAPELIPGRNYDDDIDANRAQMRGLDIDAPDYDERHAALMTELRRLRDLDTTPDRGSCARQARRGGALDGLRPVSGPWLESTGYRVRASKTKVAVEQGWETGRDPPD